MAHPQVSIGYLLELEELQRQMPTLRLWQLDGVLRARAGAGHQVLQAAPMPMPIPQPPVAAIVPVAPHAPAEQRPLQPLSVAAEPYKPKDNNTETQHVPTFAEIASLRPKQQAAYMPIQSWLDAASKAMVQQQQAQQQHVRAVSASTTEDERRSPSRLEVTGPRRGRDSPA